MFFSVVKFCAKFEVELQNQSLAVSGGKKVKREKLAFI